MASDEQPAASQDQPKADAISSGAVPTVCPCHAAGGERASVPPAGAAPSAATAPPPLEPQASDDAVNTYIERRLKPQAAWFCKKATGAKRIHHWLIGAQVAATTSIPMLNMLTLQHRNFTYLSTAAAAVSGLAAGVAGFGKFREHWVRYRQTATTLENMELEYELSLAPFNGPDRNNLLIGSVRKLLGDEQKLWLADVKTTGAIRSANSSGVPTTMARSNSQSDDDS